MSLAARSPFRQLSRAYTSLLRVDETVNRLSESTASTAELVKALDESVRALKPPEPLVIQATPRPIDVHDKLGFLLLLDESSLVDKTVITQGTWEAEQLSYMSDVMNGFRGREKTAFLDIGSYWGLYSLVAARLRVFDRQYAFEADRTNFSQLQANRFLNKLARTVTSLNCAVSDSPGTLQFWDSQSHPDGNRAGVGVVSGTEGLASYPVQAVRLDDVVDLSGGHLLMKIDVEGHEEYVLRGMDRLLAENKVAMQIEIFDLHRDNVFAEVKRLGLRQFHSIYPDYYLTNMSEDELGR